MNWLSRWLNGVSATTNAMMYKPRRRAGESPASGFLISAAVLLLLFSSSTALAQMRAGARTIIEGNANVVGGTTDYDEGETAASANSSGYDFLLGYNEWAGDLSATVDGADADRFLRTRVDAFSEVPTRGPVNGIADAGWQDIIRLSPPSGLSRPASIQIFIVIDATLQFDRIAYGGYGVTDIDLFLAPSLWGARPDFGTIPDIWQAHVQFLQQLDVFLANYNLAFAVNLSLTEDPVNPLIRYFWYRRAITLNYDPVLDGYPFSAHLRTRVRADGVQGAIDNSATIVAITDVDGFDLAGQGFRLSSDSGMNLSQNSPPIADAGENQIVECLSAAGAPVQLDGTGSSDPDGDALTYQWSAAGVEFDDPTSATPIALFPLGSTTVTLVVTDEFGAVASSDVIITVEDSVAPEITAVVTSQNALWPPNHQMVPVEVAVLLRDDCSLPQFLHVSGSVRSNERDDFDGDGKFTGDVNFADGYASPVPFELTYDSSTGRFLGTLLLRAERNDSPDGRKYSITINAGDAFGNQSASTAIVVVPKSQGGKKK